MKNHTGTLLQVIFSFLFGLIVGSYTYSYHAHRTVTAELQKLRQAVTRIEVRLGIVPGGVAKGAGNAGS